MSLKKFVATLALFGTLAGCAAQQANVKAQQADVRWINAACPNCNYQSDLAACNYDVSLRFTPQTVQGGILTRVITDISNASEPQRLLNLCMAAKGWRLVPVDTQAQTIPATPKTSSTTEIPLKDGGSGVYELPVKVNGVITLDFILDTGASEVNIPADLAVTLWRAGTITDNDFLPGKAYTLADGSTVKSSRLNIRELEIQGIKISQVPASISSVNGSLLLGQSFLGRMGSWSLDNNRHILIIGGGVSSPTEAHLEGKESTRISKQTIDDCINEANDNPVYNILFKKMPKHGDPSLAQLSDNSLATDSEIKLLLAYYDDLKPCREQLIDAMTSTNPAAGSIFAQSCHVEDFITADLIQRKITWGEANKKMSVNLYNTKAKLLEVVEHQKP